MNGVENLNEYDTAYGYFKNACELYAQCECFKPEEEFKMDAKYLYKIAFCFHNARRFVKDTEKNEYLNHLMFSSVLDKLYDVNYSFL